MALNSDTSIPGMVFARVAAHGAEVVLRKKDRGIWKAQSWATLGKHVNRVAASLQAIGFQQGDIACVIAATRPEWVEIDLGILAAGGISSGMDPAAEQDQVGLALRNSSPRVLFVENEEQLDKVLVSRAACATLERIVILDMKGLRDFADPACENWQDFLARGTTAASVIADITPDRPALLLFPSGAGKPTTLSHREALRLVADEAATLQPHAGDERLAVLPMSDRTERVFGLYLALYARVVSNYLESPSTVLENLQEVQPTILGADAAMWELLYARTTQAIAGATHVQRLLSQWAIGAGGRGGPESAVANVLVLGALRRDLGLARLRLAYIGASGVAPEVQSWAAALGIDIRQIDSRVRNETTEQSRRAVQEEVFSA